MSSPDRIKYAAKVVVSHALYYTGLLQLWQRIAMRRRAVVLMYHRVLTNEERLQTGSHPALVVNSNTFAMQMALLKRRFTVLSAERLADHLERRVALPHSACMITFDDGWRDNFTNALPILRRHALPAVVFLPVNYIGSSRLFWQEALTHLLTRASVAVSRDPGARMRLEPVLAVSGLSHLLDALDDDPRPQILRAVATQKVRSRESIEALISSLAVILGVRLEDFAALDGFMTWEQVEAMGREGVSFGAHGVEHLLLTQIPEADADREIHDSKMMLETRLQSGPTTFSYPNGYCTPAIVEKVRTGGYRLAFITRRGLVGCTDDPMTIHRLNVHETSTDSAPMFLARLVGLW
jgi:peptidoglycan/xylan/chitin deacetylase (PgdA/CDA1 family)